jgi:hypothetical protein
MNLTPRKKQKTLPGLIFMRSYALVLLCSYVAFAVETLPETAKLVPSDTVVLVDIGSFSQLRTQFEKTNFYKLYKDPAMGAFIEDFKSKCQEQIKKIDEDAVRTILETAILPQGRVALAVVLNEKTKEANEPPLLFITQWGDGVAKIKETVDKMVQKAIEDGASRKTEDYRGVSVTTITKQPSLDLSFCFIDDCLIGAANPEILQFTVAHLRGATSPALAQDADYIATMRTVGPYDDIDFYINIKRIVQTVIADDTSGQAKTVVTNLGLDNVTSLGFSVGVSREAGSGLCGKVFLKIDGAKKGICRMFEMESAAISVPQFVPPSAYSVAFLNLSLKNVYDELYRILFNFSPPLAALMQMPLVPPSPEGEPGVQLKADIIDHLGSQIVIAQSADKQAVATGTQTPTESLFAFAVTNRSAVEKSLSLLHSKIIAPNKPDARRELLGHTIYVVDISAFLPGLSPGQTTPMQAPDALAPGAIPSIPKLAFTVTDTHLIFGSEDVVEKTVRTLSSRQTGTLASAAWFNKAKLAIPQVVGLAALQDNATSTELFWKLLKEMAQNKNKEPERQIRVAMDLKTLMPQLMASGGGLDVLFNFALLPEFDTVRKYFGLSAFYGISRQDGFFFEVKHLNPIGVSN